MHFCKNHPAPALARAPAPAGPWAARCGTGVGLFMRRLVHAVLLMLLLALAMPGAQASEKLVICYDKARAPLVPLAKLQNFYAIEGIDVELMAFVSGRQSLEAMFAGKCSLSTVAESPAVHYSLYRQDFFILAVISMSDNFERLIVRTDRGIQGPADLRGRRIAVPSFTIAHYFLDMYLLVNGLTPQDVKQVYLAPPEVAPAFQRGEVDAASDWEPNIHMLAQKFGAKAKVLAFPGLHVSPFVLVGGRDYVRQHPQTVQKVLRALLRSERYAREQSAAAKALLAPLYGMTLPELDLVWSLQDLRVSLNHSLPFILENAARWEISLLPPEQRPKLPNYLDFIHLDALLATKPGAVSIIH